LSRSGGLIIPVDAEVGDNYKELKKWRGLK